MTDKEKKLAEATFKLTSGLNLSNEDVLAILFAMKPDDPALMTIVVTLHDTLERNSQYCIGSLAKSIQQWSEENP